MWSLEWPEKTITVCKYLHDQTSPKIIHFKNFVVAIDTLDNQGPYDYWNKSGYALSATKGNPEKKTLQTKSPDTVNGPRGGPTTALPLAQGVHGPQGALQVDGPRRVVGGDGDHRLGARPHRPLKGRHVQLEVRCGADLPEGGPRSPHPCPNPRPRHYSMTRAPVEARGCRRESAATPWLRLMTCPPPGGSGAGLNGSVVHANWLVAGKFGVKPEIQPTLVLKKGLRKEKKTNKCCGSK